VEDLCPSPSSTWEVSCTAGHDPPSLVRARQWEPVAIVQSIGASPCQFDGGKIVDRGKGKGTFRRIAGVNNPLTNTWTEVPENLAAAAAAAALGIPAVCETRWRENGDTMVVRRKGRPHGNTLMEHDPIRHAVTRPSPDDAAQARRDRDAARLWGMLGIRHQTPPQGSYDPIRCGSAAREASN
jgi:hypothetical protein